MKQQTAKPDSLWSYAQCPILYTSDKPATDQVPDESRESYELEL